MPGKHRSNRGFVRGCYILVGWLSLSLALVGIIVPLLPTTPFLLLSAFCFARSSYRWHRWLMYNRFFGPYLRAYKSGRGIPLSMKVWILSLLWLTIGYCMVFVTRNMHVQIMLGVVVIAVTTHILHIKTAKRGRRNMKKIVVLSATKMELSKFKADSGVCVEEIGVGQISATYRTQQIIRRYEPDIVVLAGVAGAYQGSGLCVGESVLVSDETEADLGVMYDDGFRPLSECGFVDPDAAPYTCGRLETPFRLSGYKHVRSNSVNCAATPVADASADIENMEGAGFFYVALQSGVEFYELRTVSNIVSTDRSSWNMELATTNLAAELQLLIAKLREKNQPKRSR